MTSHVDAAVRARIARVRAEEERKRREREEFAARRTAGLAKRHATKLRHLAELGQDLAPAFDNFSLAASGS